ncbi:hypothetical protein FMM68_06250 [Lachnospiraceae bacterium MD329]|nr:hypothetical protein [Lachnospiraceae bacterium MD329]
MKFKTFVITKKKLMATALGAIMVVSGAIAAKLLTEKSVSVFKDGTNVYENILSEELPDSEEKHFSIRTVINKIVGFDMEEPETVISQYSPIFEGTTSDTEDIPEPPAEELPEESTSEETQSEEPSLPDKAQICSSVGLKLNNATKYDVDVNALCSEEISLSADTSEPLVLIVHTHTTECYNGDEMSGETERNTDDTLNVVAVGEEIKATLEANGINAVHDTTYHDYPSYQGAYSRALTTIENQLKANPSIKIVLDVHRDAFIYPDGSKLSVSYDENGVSTAQVMLVVGTNSMGLWHDNWRENLKFASKIQNAAEIMYPGLMRPINLRTERFNEHMTLGSLILEVGSNGNSLAEAKAGGREVARAMAAVLNAK